MTTVPPWIIYALDRLSFRAEGRQMPSIGPFDLTETEVIGLEFLRQEDERQLRKTGLHATRSGRVLTVKVKKFLFGIQ